MALLFAGDAKMGTGRGSKYTGSGNGTADGRFYSGYCTSGPTADGVTHTVKYADQYSDPMSGREECGHGSGLWEHIQV